MGKSQEKKRLPASACIFFCKLSRIGQGLTNTLLVKHLKKYETSFRRNDTFENGSYKVLFDFLKCFDNNLQVSVSNIQLC